MYKVLIVDDEVLVRIGLKNTIDWESIGFTVVGEASNGEQGFAQFEALDPDVVITDIKMPKKDGLWLTEQIHKTNKHTKIVVLTCYDEFQYARTALKNGASDYMLKSEIIDDELVELMGKLKATLDESPNKPQNKSASLINQKAIKRALVNDLIKVKFNLDDRLSLRLNEQQMLKPDSKYAFIYLENDSSDHPNAKQISETTVNLVADQINEKGYSFLFNGYMDEHLFLHASPDLTLTQLNRIANSVENGVLQYFNLKLKLIYTSTIASYDQLGLQHDLLLKGKEQFFYISKSESYVENLDHIKWELVEPQKLKKTYVGEFIDWIGKEDASSAIKRIDELAQMFNQNQHPPKLLKLLVIQIIGELYSAYQYVFDNTELNFNFAAFHESILNTKHLDQLIVSTSELLSLIVHELKYIRRNQSKHLIKRAINFIDHNYDQNISLEDVAKVINLSKQYVCHIFKKETGQNLSHYINQVRIEKAKQLLLNPANSNKDIYSMVGFSNQQYFSRVFKKMTNMTTSEYKEKYYQKDN